MSSGHTVGDANLSGKEIVKMPLRLQCLAFKAIKTLLIQSLTVPEDLEDVVAYVSSKPMKGNPIFKGELIIDFPLMKALNKASSVIKMNMSSFYPIAKCGTASSGFAAVSQAITGTAKLKYLLILQVYLYWSRNKDEMIGLIQKLNLRFRNIAISFEDEVKQCLMANTNYLTWYALSRVLRCTINIWVVYYDGSKGNLQIRRYSLVPPEPEMNTFEKIDILELLDGPSKNYQLLIAKKPPGPESLKLGDDVNTLQKVSFTYLIPSNFI